LIWKNLSKITTRTDGEAEEEVDTELFENALYLKKLRVRDCMVPRREITAIDINDSVEELKKLIIETYHSRILIFDDSIDKIVGYIHHFDLHKKPGHHKIHLNGN
jgi:putative hemolysin